MNIKVEATLREKGKKSDLNNYRREGFIPAVIYGEGKVGINILLNKIDFMKNYKKSIGEVAFFDFDLSGKKISTFIKEKQVHPVSRDFVHIDFMELHKGTTITLEVPLHYKGIAEGTKEGGALEILHHTLEISCLPKDIPDEIEIDVTNLKIGDSIHFREIKLSEGVTSSMTEATTLVAVRAPKKEEVVEEVEAIEGATTEGEATEGEAETSEPDAAE